MTDYTTIIADIEAKLAEVDAMKLSDAATGNTPVQYDTIALYQNLFDARLSRLEAAIFPTTPSDTTEEGGAA